MKPKYHVVTWPEAIGAGLLLGYLIGAAQVVHLEWRLRSELQSIDKELDLKEKLILEDICAETMKTQYEENLKY